MNYKSYKLVMFMVNVNGGESETVEHLYKEVDGKNVPMTEEQSILKMLKETSTIGGNDAVQNVKAMLYNPEGNMIKVEEVKKPTTTPVIDEKQIAIDKAIANYMANPTDENLEKIKEAVTGAEE